MGRLAASLKRAREKLTRASRAALDTVRARVMRAEIIEAEDGWRWRVVSNNGRIRADSGEAYTREADARRAWNTFERDMMIDGPLLVKTVYKEDR
jgi:uncharacterized protein YegP (UPF0339 family)